ncbi:hypothetical protein FACS1894110_19220 [Spirochaetia bacterium]|nr:hypothetical protein FACS1894110_19220 [Spirochaetia bacterium]
MDVVSAGITTFYVLYDSDLKDGKYPPGKARTGKVHAGKHGGGAAVGT